MEIINTIKSSGCPESDGGVHYEAHCADRIRIVWWDGSGVCLYSKTLEDQGFCWPGISAARIRLDHSQLMALLAGMDWKKIRPNKVRRPLLTG
ncbi:IS66 family insertion sequence element accessory protein TnpB [Neorhizobium petrolearium]|uniref:IS66 family insertion sequence element accessory protein TnpB n=1 Tax=Neorhizobium petrolearium TaxID=515361 RepID=UPI001AE8E97C|nr:IS66 family insertion sequence element accessory protein TnpB [Neorhizobium petrolearium]